MSAARRLVCVGALLGVCFQSGCLLVLDRSRREGDAGRQRPGDAGFDADRGFDAGTRDAGAGRPCRDSAQCGAPGWARCTSSFEGRCEPCQPTFTSPAVLSGPRDLSLVPGTLRVAIESGDPGGWLHVVVSVARGGRREAWVASVDPSAPEDAELEWLGMRWERYLQEAAFATREGSPPVLGAIADEPIPVIEAAPRAGAEGPFRELELPMDELGQVSGPPVGHIDHDGAEWYWVRQRERRRLIGWISAIPPYRVGPEVDADTRLLASLAGAEALLYERAGELRAWAPYAGDDYAIALPDRAPGFLAIAGGSDVLAAYPNTGGGVEVAWVENFTDGLAVAPDEPRPALGVGMEAPTVAAVAQVTGGFALLLSDGENVVAKPLDGARRPHEDFHPGVLLLDGDVELYREPDGEVLDLAAAGFARGDEPALAFAAMVDRDRVVVRTLHGCAP